MDYFKCDKCGRVFDEFEMDFKFVQDAKCTLCRKCRDEYKTRAEFMKEYLDRPENQKK